MRRSTRTVQSVQHAPRGEIDERQRAVLVACGQEIAVGGLGVRGGIGAYAGEAHDEAVVGGDFAGGFEFVGIKENKTKTAKKQKNKKQMKNKERQQQVGEESIDSTNSLNC